MEILGLRKARRYGYLINLTIEENYDILTLQRTRIRNIGVEENFGIWELKRTWRYGYLKVEFKKEH